MPRSKATSTRRNAERRTPNSERRRSNSEHRRSNSERRTSNEPPAPAESSPQFRFVGGKGGVGKTTCAAAMAVIAARSGRRTLVVSTDPAPSLGDALAQRLVSAPRPVRGVRNLHAVEIDAAAALRRWLGTRRDLLETIAVRGTWLDREDVSRLLELSLPGIDEIAGFLEIAALGDGGRYDHVIVDTAPTGHLLRMLDMPAVLQGVAQAFDHMQAKHRILVEALRGGWTPDATDALIDEVDRQARDVSALLRDPERTRLSWVTLAEMMSVEETADGIRALRDNGVRVDQVIVNRVTAPPPQPCRWCSARRKDEHRAIQLLQKTVAVRDIPLQAIPAVGSEPRGVAALAAVGRLIEAPQRPRRGRTNAAPGRVSALLPARGRAGESPGIPPHFQLVMFGGKGGVGKTTCAAAAAIAAAAASPRRRILLLSADPAHSLGDVLGQRLSDDPSRIRGGPRNVGVRELDAHAVFQRLRERFAGAIEELFVRIAGGGAVQASVAAQDRQVMRDLLDLAPPGVDELVAIIDVTEALTGEPVAAAWDLVVIDTAPTGHALRLIEMPALVHDWVKAVMAILLKYQPVVGVGELGAVLLRLSQGLGRLRAILTNPARTQFVVVTRPAALPRAETIRLLERLKAASVPVAAVVVNAVGAGTCSRCRRDRTAQQREIAALRTQLPAQRRVRPSLTLTPAELPPPHGWRQLRQWRSRWTPAGQ